MIVARKGEGRGGGRGGEEGERVREERGRRSERVRIHGRKGRGDNKKRRNEEMEERRDKGGKNEGKVGGLSGWRGGAGWKVEGKGGDYIYLLASDFGCI